MRYEREIDDIHSKNQGMLDGYGKTSKGFINRLDELKVKEERLINDVYRVNKHRLFYTIGAFLGTTGIATIATLISNGDPETVQRISENFSLFCGSMAALGTLGGAAAYTIHTHAVVGPLVNEKKQTISNVTKTERVFEGRNYDKRKRELNEYMFQEFKVLRRGHVDQILDNTYDKIAEISAHQDMENHPLV